MTTPILQTKLHIPPIRPGLVSRPGLIERLDAGLQSGRALTLVAAPAGFGKTTLVSAWIRDGERSVAWVSLDEDDNDPTCFWAYVTAALQTVDADIGTSLAAIHSPQPPPIKTILTSVVNKLTTSSEQITFVLDDYHVISNREIHAGIAFLVDHRPQQLHVVLSTRADPPLPIARLRGRGQLTELRADDLRFTPDEAATFLNEVMGLDLLPDDVAALEARTEGWIVGLQLAALSMQGREDPHAFVTTFTGSHHYVLEYLTGEVVHRQPEPVQRFLLQTSILDRLSGPLCNAVTGQDDGDDVLAHLQRRNLFVTPLDDEHRWYRYHHLFADLLGNLLRKELPLERILELHCRASEWYEQNGVPNGAIRHALQAQDFERAAALIEQTAQMALSQGNVTTLVRWIEALPEELVLARPHLCMYRGWAMFLNGQTALAERMLQDAKKALPAVAPSPGKEVLHGRLTALLATLATLHQDMSKAIAEGREALAHLPEEDLVWRARATRALAAAHGLSGDTNKLIQMCHKAQSLALAAGNIFLAADIMSQSASAQFHQGRLREAARSYRQIIDLVDDPSKFPPAGLGYVGLADVSLEWNDLDAAGDYVNTGIELYQQGGIGHNLLPAYCTKAILRQALGDPEGALEAIREAEQIQQVLGSVLMAVHLAWYQVRLRLLLGDVETAARWAKGEGMSAGVSFGNLPTVLREVQQVALARVYLAQGRPERVLAIYDALCAPAQAGGRMARVIEISLLKALALQAQGEIAAARVPFEQCLSLAEPGGYVRTFLDAGAPVVELLRQAASRGTSPGCVSQLLAAFGAQGEGSALTRPRPGTHALVEPLTSRELEVLQLICEGCSNRQISERLVVTLNTVKKHTSHIYDKLGVRSRTQAIACAQELGLLS